MKIYGIKTPVLAALLLVPSAVLMSHWAATRRSAAELDQVLVAALAATKHEAETGDLESLMRSIYSLLRSHRSFNYSSIWICSNVERVASAPAFLGGEAACTQETSGFSVEARSPLPSLGYEVRARADLPWNDPFRILIFLSLTLLPATGAIAIRMRKREKMRVESLLVMLETRVEHAHKQVATHAADAQIGKNAAKVAHDLRSPLAALEAAMQGMEGIKSERGELVRQATDRIRKIAEDLLRERKRSRLPVAFEEAPRQSLQRLLRKIITEKQAEHSSGLGNPIDLRLEEKSFSENIFTRVPENDLARIVSNLINNSVEAHRSAPVTHQPAEILLSVSVSGARLFLDIVDNGPGMDPSTLRAASEGNAQSTKISGNGIGLSIARESVLGWNSGQKDSFQIESHLGMGTKLRIELPTGS